MKVADPAAANFVARRTNEFILAAMAELGGLFGGDIVLGLVFLAINQASIAHRPAARFVDPFEGDGVVPDELRRPVAVLGVAASLGIPRETARRHVGKLIEMGYCVRTSGRRVIVPASVYRRPEILAATQAYIRHIESLIRSLRRGGVLQAATGEPA